MLKEVLSMSERLACKAVGLARSTYRDVPLSQTSADPDAELRAWLREYAGKHPCHGFRRAWAALRYDEHRTVNKKKVQRLWAEEGLQRRVRSRRKRSGESSSVRWTPLVGQAAAVRKWGLLLLVMPRAVAVGPDGRPHRGYACSGLGGGAGCCRTRSSRRVLAWPGCRSHRL